MKLFFITLFAFHFAINSFAIDLTSPLIAEHIENFERREQVSYTAPEPFMSESKKAGLDSYNQACSFVKSEILPKLTQTVTPLMENFREIGLYPHDLKSVSKEGELHIQIPFPSEKDNLFSPVKKWGQYEKQFSLWNDAHWEGREQWLNTVRTQTDLYKKCQILKLAYVHAAWVAGILSPHSDVSEVQKLMFDLELLKSDNEEKKLFLEDIHRAHYAFRYLSILKEEDFPPNCELVQPMKRNLYEEVQKRMEGITKKVDIMGEPHIKKPLGLAFGMCLRTMHAHYIDQLTGDDDRIDYMSAENIKVCPTKVNSPLQLDEKSSGFIRDWFHHINQWF